MLTGVIVKIAFVFAMIMGLFAPLMTWVERKQSAVMQDRIGANRADIAGITLLGLLHPLTDVIKLITKEDVVPLGANRLLHLISPLLAVVPALISFAVIPFGGTYQLGEGTYNLVVADCDWGVLYLFAIGSIAAYGTILSGWASNNNWSLLGSLRGSAQMISYEVCMGLSLVGVMMVFGTLKLSEMSHAQDTTFRLLGFLELFGWVSVLPWWVDWIRVPNWGIFLQPLGCIMFLTAIMAENKRPPFDQPEGESEIIAGYFTEYSGMRFGLFYTAEFVEVVVIAGIMTAIFLGGWSIPYLSTQTIIDGVSSVIGTSIATILCIVLHVLTFWIKVCFMIWVQMGLRWLLPRFRYDQLMDLCWKNMLPLSLANIVVTALILLWIDGMAR